MAEKKGQKRRTQAGTSEAPLDLTKERETFVRTFLRKGVEFAEELLQENKHLRAELSRLQTENARLRTQVASDDAIRELLRTIEGLERERNDLIERSSELERVWRRYEGRYTDLENELNDLANLYVASFQLHATLSLRRVVRHIKELLLQLVGAEAFVIYVLDSDGKIAVPLGSEGIAEADVRPVAVGEGVIGEACFTGIAQVSHTAPLARGTLAAPLAVIPMMVDGRPVGAISVVSLLQQKNEWASVDRELFKLLGAHGATALIAANLYASAPGPVPALSGIRDNLVS